MVDTIVLHARIGRTIPRSGATGAAVRGVSTPQANDARAGTRNGTSADARTRGALRALRDQVARVPAVLALLALLVLALWPHWVWMARRLTDGSDEPWGVLAAITVLLLVAREWRLLTLPSRSALHAAAALAIAAAVAKWTLPPIIAATIAMASLATFLTAARRDRPVLPLVSLLLLALPVIASLQFYFGYPLRVATAALASPVLHTLGFAAQAQGAALVYEGRTVLVDPPCAGIGMLWVGAYTAALLSYLANAPLRHALRNTAVAALSVFAANVVRNVALFFPEGLDLRWPAWAHPGIGLAAFALAIVPIALVAAGAPNRTSMRAASVWPARFHRHHA